MKVLTSAEFIKDSATNVFVNEQKCQEMADFIYNSMLTNHYDIKSSWSKHPLNADRDVVGHSQAVDWIFTIDLLNFSFWSEYDDEDTGKANTRYCVEYKGNKYTGYWSLVAAINKALDNGIPIIEPRFWVSERFTKEVLDKVLESANSQEIVIPMLDDRYRVLREAGNVLINVLKVDSFTQVISQAEKSAMRLVDLVSFRIPSFNDISRYKGQEVAIMKRAQILVSDIWCCFEGKGYGEFYDIDQITMFADYRVPQILHFLGCVSYSPELVSRIRSKKLIPNGDPMEVELRGCSIWTVEVIKRFIVQKYPNTHINSVLIDFYLWDYAKQLQQGGNHQKDIVPCHRTRSVFY